MYGLGILGEKVSKYTDRVVNAGKYLQGKVEYSTLDQFLRSGTSIGANCSEAVFAQSKADFISKLHIALKESNENRHWLKVLHTGLHINTKTYESMESDCIEIQKLLSTIIKHTKDNMNKT
ncbi:MAG: four helix bundle protein [Paludibacteraceae bacterium]|nr:four helix bundle protein [Paludibacteraceae bacterium]